MIENFNDFMSLAVIAAIFIVSLIVAIRFFMISSNTDDEEDFFREVL